MMGMELNPRKCAMATAEKVRGLHLCLCPHLKHSIPYLGLQLQPDGEFSLPRKHRLRLAAVHNWCVNMPALLKVVQDIILAILGGRPSTLPPLSRTTLTPRATWTTSRSRSQKNRARYAFDASGDLLQDDRTLGLTPVPTRGQAILRFFFSGCASFSLFFFFCCGRATRRPLGGGALPPHRVPQGGPDPAAVPPRQCRHATQRQAAGRALMKRAYTWLGPGALPSALSSADCRSRMEYCWT